MQVGIDQRCQRRRRLNRGVQAKPHLAQERQVRPEPGCDDHAVGQHCRCTPVPPPGDGQHAICIRDPVDQEGSQRRHDTAFDQPLRPRTKFAALGEAVARTAAEVHRTEGAAKGPQDAGAWCALRQIAKIEHRIHRRMPGADDERGVAGIDVALRGEHVGDAVGDAVRLGDFAWRWHAVAARRVRRVPGARAVDHCACLDRLDAAAGFDMQYKAGGVTRFAVMKAAEIAPRDPDNASAHADVWVHRADCRERGEVAMHQIVAGRIGIGLGRHPALSLQQEAGGSVDVVAPGGEHPHMSPGAHRVADLGSSLQHQRFQPAGQKLRSCGEPYGPGADNDDRKRACSHGDDP